MLKQPECRKNVLNEKAAVCKAVGRNKLSCGYIAHSNIHKYLKDETS